MRPLLFGAPALLLFCCGCASPLEEAPISSVSEGADMSAFGAPVEATVEYGSSSIYFKSDMDSAIALIQDTFASRKGCELHTIRCFSDDACNDENIAWMNDLADGQGLDVNFTQCIMFESDFHSPKNGGGAWNHRLAMVARP